MEYYGNVKLDVILPSELKEKFINLIKNGRDKEFNLGETDNVKHGSSYPDEYASDFGLSYLKFNFECNKKMWKELFDEYENTLKKLIKEIADMGELDMGDLLEDEME